VQPFLHDRLQRLEDLLDASSEALRSYGERDLGYADHVADLLDRVAFEYAGMGRADAENDVRALGAMLAAAHQGIDALTSERLDGRRREFERSVALRGLLSSGERLRTDYAQARETLAEAREQLVPLLLFAVGKGLVPAGAGELTQTELEQLWQALSADPDSRAAAQSVAAKVSGPDVLILLADLAADADVRA
jgi:hypothetical protein